MDFGRGLLPKPKNVALISIYILFLLILFEVSSRAFWAVRGVPFLRPEEIITHQFYPELRWVKERKIDSENGYFDVLLLGGSVLHDDFGDVGQILLEKLTFGTKSNVRIHNVSENTHTSLDSYYKYKHLQEKDFDLVIFYHGINEVRANNIPPPLFRSDYSHYGWYEQINAFEEYSEIGLLTIPYTLRYLWLEVKIRVNSDDYISVHSGKKEWVEFGRNIWSKASFENNLMKILEIAERKNENVLLMTFAFHVPEDYSLTKFKSKSLDYDLHLLPIELWGSPENVVSGIAAHNRVIESLADRYNNVTLIDQNMLIPKRGQYFNDICHLTHQGSKVFADNISDAILATGQSE